MKKIQFIICILFVFQMFFIKASSYENFEGRYKYNEYNPNNKYSANISDSDEEVLFIMDFSASMSKRMGYSPKAFLAIDAIRSILSESGQTTKIGLRVFGITDKPLIEQDRDGYAYNKANICSASSLLLPVARYNNQNISDRLSTLIPQGATPIGYALRQAIQNDFSPNATIKHIILITDGGENCGDDPCLYIKRIMQMRNDIKIDVIGITVDDNAYSQLKCIANASQGNYHAINDADDFKIKFKKAFESQKQLNVKTIKPEAQKTQNIHSGIKYKNYVYEFEE